MSMNTYMTCLMPATTFNTTSLVTFNDFKALT